MKTFVSTGLAVVAATASAASAGLSLVQSNNPSGTTSTFNAIGTFNFDSQKAQLEAIGQSTVHGGNPGNGWWGYGTSTTTGTIAPASVVNVVGTFNSGNPKARPDSAGRITEESGHPGSGGGDDGSPSYNGTSPIRSWEVKWNNTTGTVNFLVYSTDNWTGTAAMSMTQTPTLTSGNVLRGLSIGARLTSSLQSVTLNNVQFDSGSGFVDVNTAQATYSGNSTFSNYHALTGTLGNFTIRGTTMFQTGLTSGDSMRFFVDGQQGSALLIVPLPTAALAGLAGLACLGLIRRRNNLV